MSTTLLSAVGATGASTAKATGTRSSILINVRSASTSSCTVKIQQSVDGLSTDVGWYTVATITDPTSAGELWAGPAAPYTRVNVTAWASGAITAVEDEKLILGDPLGQEWRKIDQAAESFGALSVSNLTNSALTAGRVPYSGTGGLQSDEAAFAYNAGTNTLTVGTVVAALTGAVTGNVTGDVTGAVTGNVTGDLTGNVTGNVTGTLIGGQQDDVNVYASDGAISVAPQTALLTKAGVGAYTLAAPTATTHDGYVVKITSSTANAHVVTFPSGKINGGSLVTATFGGAIGDAITIVAYNGVWLTSGAPRNVTIA